MSYSIGILDQSIRLEGETNEQTIERTVELAQLAEKWGYARFWVAEHHNNEETAGSAPEILAAYLLAKTKTIKIGSGGVMLQHYSPYKVAEQFQLLATLAPGRVDLGVGKGPGGLPLSTKALQYGTHNYDVAFEDKLRFLQQLLQQQVPQNHELSGVQATPIPAHSQQLILLGASENSAQQAKDFGVVFSFANFFNGDDAALAKAARIYKEENPTGYFILALLVVVAETEEEAEQLASGQRLYRVTLESGKSVTVTSEESGVEFATQAGEGFVITEIPNNYIAGTAEQVKAQLDALYETYHVDEFIVHTPIRDAEKRLKSFELLQPATIFEKQFI